MKFACAVSIAVVTAVLAACSGSAPEPKTPDERIEEDKAKLKDIERHGGGEGTEFAAEKVQDDLDAAEKEKADQEASEKAGEAAAEGEPKDE